MESIDYVTRSDSLLPSVQSATTFLGPAHHPRWKYYYAHLSLPVMVNFICQIDWTTGCPDIWSNIILSVSVRVFLDDINI